MINRKDHRPFRRGMSKYYPTTIEEALKRVYEVKPMKNNLGDYSAGVVYFPKVLNGELIKIKIVKQTLAHKQGERK